MPYGARADEARARVDDHGLNPAADDGFRICLVLVDVQNTFCILARSSTSPAVRETAPSTTTGAPLRVHLLEPERDHPDRPHHRHASGDAEIFHPIWLVDADGKQSRALRADHGRPTSKAGAGDSIPAVAASAQVEEDYAERQLLHYTRALEAGGKYSLTIWPYHAMLGGIGHALALSVEEAVFFHSVALLAAELRGQGREPADRALLDLRAGVREGPDGEPIASANEALIERLLGSTQSSSPARRKPLRRVDDRRPPGGRRRARARALALATYLPEDCTLSGRRGGRRLHGRSQRRVPPVRRRRGCVRRQVERTDGELARSSASCFR